MTNPVPEQRPSDTAFADLPEVQLLSLCRQRVEGALRYLIQANNQRLFRTAFSILRDRSDAEEAVQATYLLAFGGIDRFEGRSSLSTWLTRIAVNESLGRIRARKRRAAAFEDQGVAVLDSYREALMRGSDQPTPDAAVAREEIRLMLERAITDLPDPFRTVFVLREIEGLSGEDTAVALDIPVATVKTRLLRARRRLQETLAPDVKTALAGAFPFAGADCAAMTERALVSLLKPDDADGATS